MDFEVPLASHLAPFLHLNPLKINQKNDMFFNPFLDDIFMRKLVKNEADLQNHLKIDPKFNDFLDRFFNGFWMDLEGPDPQSDPLAPMFS